MNGFIVNSKECALVREKMVRVLGHGKPQHLLRVVVEKTGRVVQPTLVLPKRHDIWYVSTSFHHPPRAQLERFGCGVI
jgi:hypothetical protein